MLMFTLIFSFFVSYSPLIFKLEYMQHTAISRRFKSLSAYLLTKVLTIKKMLYQNHVTDCTADDA